MRILKLRLKYFAPPYYSLDRDEVTLDYTRPELKSKVIFIFVGKMGSCKTFLLGHHTPFATLGSLDARNSEDMVMPGKRGVKEISYSHNGHLYEIMHIYIPVKIKDEDRHQIKSYMKKDGEELNPNGNNSSFLSLVETEFGLDQNYLKLFRIGSNVTNLLDMSSSERRTFISSMLSETENYIALHRRISDKSRATTAQMTMLLNRLRAISSKSEEELEEELTKEQESLDETNSKYAQTMKDAYRIEAELKALLGDDKPDHIDSMIYGLKKIIDRDTATIKASNEILQEVKDIPSITDLTQKITTVRAQHDMLGKQNRERALKLDQLNDELTSVQDKLAMLASKDQIENTRKTYSEMMVTLQDYERRLAHFTFDGSMATIDTFLSELHSVDGMIAQTAQFNIDAIHDIFKNPQRAVNQAQYRIKHLMKEQTRLTHELEHLGRVSVYVPTHNMLVPFNCPTLDCPYYRFHPYTESRKRSQGEIDKEYLAKRSELKSVEAQMQRLEDYPSIATRIEDMKRIWKRTYEKAEALGIVTEDSLIDILTNPTRRNWWSNDKLMRIRELCGIREKYYEMMQSVAAMRNEIAVYEVSDHQSLTENEARLKREISELSQVLQDGEDKYVAEEHEIEQLSDLLGKVSRIEMIEAELHDAEDELERSTNGLAEWEEKKDRYNSLNAKSAAMNSKLTEQRQMYKMYEKAVDEIRRKLSDIKYTKEQYEEIKVQKDLLAYIIDSLSPKSGIPVAFVRIFLAECKDTINDLISDVFQDSLEITDFNIPDESPEFLIPYIKNGQLISDVKAASQGERAIISLAISFALIRQAMFQYNIMLLDEMDGPLYKEDRNKFIAILMKQLADIEAEQVFLVSHNNTFDGYNVGIIMTTDEVIDESPLTAVVRI